MVGLRALDDILADQERETEKSHLVERWNAQVDARNSASRPGVPPPLPLQARGQPPTGFEAIIDAQAEPVTEAGGAKRQLTSAFVPVAAESEPATKSVRDKATPQQPASDRLVSVAAKAEDAAKSSTDAPAPQERTAELEVSVAGEPHATSKSPADTASRPASAAELPAHSATPPALVATGPHLQNRARLVLPLGALVIGASALIFVVVATHRSADQIASRGDANRRSGDIEGGINDYTEAIRIYRQSNLSGPRLAEIYGNRGNLFLSRGEYGRAVEDFTEVLDLEPRNAHALLARADALRDSGDREQAIADYVAAIGLDADNDLVWINRGDEREGASDLGEALKIFRDTVAAFQGLVRAEPTNVRWRRDLSLAEFRVGGVLYKDRRFSEALDADRESLSIVRALVGKDPNNTQLREDMDRLVAGIGGISYHMVLKKDFSRALDAANLAISVSPKKMWLYSKKAHALMFLGRIESARSIYLQYRGVPNVSGSNGWELTILADFSEMRRAGLNHSLMNDIENRFNRRD
jgi:tetratricopeptide (TPR) repeat protein